MFGLPVHAKGVVCRRLFAREIANYLATVGAASTRIVITADTEIPIVDLRRAVGAGLEGTHGGNDDSRVGDSNCNARTERSI